VTTVKRATPQKSFLSTLHNFLLPFITILCGTYAHKLPPADCGPNPAGALNSGGEWLTLALLTVTTCCCALETLETQNAPPTTSAYYNIKMPQFSGGVLTLFLLIKMPCAVVTALKAWAVILHVPEPESVVLQYMQKQATWLLLLVKV